MEGSITDTRAQTREQAVLDAAFSAGNGASSEWAVREADAGAKPFAAPSRATTRRVTAHALLEGPAWPWVRVSVDAVMCSLAVVSALVGADRAGVAMDGAAALYALPVLVVFLLWRRGLYRPRIKEEILDTTVSFVAAVGIASLLIAGFEMFTAPDARPGPLIARAFLFTLVYAGAGRVALGLTHRAARAREYVGKRTLIVGAGEVGEQVARRIDEHPEYGLRPLGFLDVPVPNSPGPESQFAVLGAPRQLEAVAAEHGAEHVVVAYPSIPDRELVALSRRCDQLGIEVTIVPRLFEAINDRVGLERLGGLPLHSVRTIDPKGWQFGLKYTLDRVAAALALTVAAIPMGLIALGVKLSSPGPVLFRQRRVGRDGQVFDLLKFRSMRPADPRSESFTPADGSAPGGVEGVDRRTAIGRFLRRSSLDELPQLLNVLRGDMSLIGPRPERPEFVELFRQDLDRYADRHRVKSGISGWAQVHGLRGQTSLADRVEWDNFYIENWSLWLDCKILLLTIGAVFRAADEA